MEKLNEATSHPTRSPAEKILTRHPEDGNPVSGKKSGLIIFICLAIASCGGGDASLPAGSPMTSTAQSKPKHPGGGEPPVVTSSKLNDTGVTDRLCSKEGSYGFVPCNSAGAIALSNAQDGMVGRDANVTTNDNADGKLGFSFASIAGGCVQDNVTGLMWEVKTADGLRGWANTFTNYGDNRAGDANAYQSAVNATNLCGYSDWRLPTPAELQSIVDYGVPNPGPTIDTDWFPNNGNGAYWSASPYFLPGFAWTVAFLNGTVSAFDRANLKYVRLVRGGKSQTSSRYTVSADGQEVTDNNTGLIWRRCVEGMTWNGSDCTGDSITYTHDKALQQAASLASNSGSAWRLPNAKELYSIVDTSFIRVDTSPIYPIVVQPPIDPVAFPGTPISWYWSATPSNGIPGAALSVLFTEGNVDVVANRDITGLNVRLVRDGQ